jgi:hypothetical protein
MASNITTASKNALVAASLLVRNQIQSVLQTGKYMTDADALRAIAGVTGLPLTGQLFVGQGLEDQRNAVSRIRENGRRLMDPILIQMGREASSHFIDGETVRSWPDLFREINDDLLGGTPDYFDPRAVSFASNPAASAKGIFRRLTVDYNGEPIEDGFHNATKTIRVTAKPADYQSTASIRGKGNSEGDALDYRAGRARITNGLRAINDATTPSGVLNPYLIPGDLTDEADISSIANWTINTTGTPVFKYESTAANLWRSRPGAVRFTGDNTEAIELVQRIPASVLQDGFRPWDIGVPIKLESGWSGAILITWGGKSQAFSESDLTAGSYVHLFPDLDKDLFPIEFDANGASWKIKFTNDQNNTQSIWCAGFLPQAMLQHEGLWYSHWSHADEPAIGDEVTYADTSTFVGIIQDVICFLYQDVAPGWAHLPTSGATTIADPAYAPEIGITRGDADVADEGSIALGTTTQGVEQTVDLVIANTGNAALSVGVPVTEGSPTNATLTTAGLSVPQAVEPGDTLSITVGITDAGAGAYSLTIRIDNNDADEGTYEITISGTAA